MSNNEEDNFTFINNPEMDVQQNRIAQSPPPASISYINNNNELSLIRSEISAVLRGLENLHNTALFVSSLGGDTIPHTEHNKLLKPIAVLLDEVSSLTKGLNSNTTAYSAWEEDVVYDKDLLFKWTSDGNACILGCQAKLEEEAQRMTEWMAQHSQIEKSTEEEKEDDDDEWTVLEKDEEGNVNSSPLVEKQTESENQETEPFMEDPDWELASYARQLSWMMDDLGTCVPYLKKYGVPPWGHPSDATRM